MMRTSTGSSTVAPILRTRRSWIARSSFTCIASGRSATSSSIRVPPLAAWKKPSRSSPAPVKAPLRWPKNSDSIRFSGIAPQFTATKGFAARELWAWISRAASSLPAPDSPLIAIGAIERARRAIWARSDCMAVEAPIRREPVPSPSGAVPAAFSDNFRAERTITRSSSSTTGFET